MSDITILAGIFVFITAFMAFLGVATRFYADRFSTLASLRRRTKRLCLYLVHQDGCELTRLKSNTCTCGLLDLLKETSNLMEEDHEQV